MQSKMHGRINKPKNAGLTYISKPITKETNMSEEKENNPSLLWHDCDSDCDYSQVKNGECECYNREMDKREEQAPC